MAGLLSDSLGRANIDSTPRTRGRLTLRGASDLAPGRPWRAPVNKPDALPAEIDVSLPLVTVSETPGSRAATKPPGQVSPPEGAGRPAPARLEAQSWPAPRGRPGEGRRSASSLLKLHLLPTLLPAPAPDHLARELLLLTVGTETGPSPAGTQSSGAGPVPRQPLGTWGLACCLSPPAHRHCVGGVGGVLLDPGPLDMRPTAHLGQDLLQRENQRTLPRMTLPTSIASQQLRLRAQQRAAWAAAGAGGCEPAWDHPPYPRLRAWGAPSARRLKRPRQGAEGGRGVAPTLALRVWVPANLPWGRTPEPPQRGWPPAGPPRPGAPTAAARNRAVCRKEPFACTGREGPPRG